MLVLNSTPMIEAKTEFYYLNAIIKAKGQNMVKEQKIICGMILSR